MSFDWVQAVGWIAAVLQISAFQAAKRKTVITLQVSGCLVWVVHFAALGSLSGAVFNVISASRGGVAIAAERYPVLFRWIWVFLPIIWVTSALTYQGPIDILPAICVTFSTFALMSRSVLTLRFLMLASGPWWLAYAVMVGSWGSVTNEAVAILSNLIGVYRHHLRPWLRQRRAAAAMVAPASPTEAQG